YRSADSPPRAPDLSRRPVVGRSGARGEGRDQAFDGAFGVVGGGQFLQRRRVGRDGVEDIGAGQDHVRVADHPYHRGGGVEIVGGGAEFGADTLGEFGAGIVHGGA